jgi:hypothetical protein
MAKKLTRAEIEAQRARAAANSERMARLLDKALADLERRHGNPVRPAGLSDVEWVGRLADIERAGRTE